MTQDRLIKVKGASLTARTLFLTIPPHLLPQSANYVRTELPVRISHRLRDMQALPYVVVKREGVAKVYEVRAPTPPRTHSLTPRTFLSCIGRLSKSEGKRFTAV